MSTGQLLFVIGLGSFLVVGVFTVGFITFGRFLRSEKEKAELGTIRQPDVVIMGGGQG